ncbi:MAG: hypothetical protein BRD50_01790 [Bacteroidetes bacterium SW_11_45_7]|nr:MAG: hypothetical protein BRD50_01790 [Bacteroidetes bacterium SW_11_45_7]
MRLVSLLGCLLCITSFTYSQTVIYTQDFSNGFPSDYTQETSASDGGWNAGYASSLQSQYFPIEDQGSGQLIATNDDDCGQGCDKSNDFLKTDTIDLSSYTGTKIFLRFDKFYYDAEYQNDQEQATVEISTDGGNSWTIVKDVDGGAWARESIDISSYGGQQIRIGFRYNDRGGFLFGWAIDNILVEVPTDYDIKLDSLFAPSSHKISNNPISMDATITNNGGETITSFDINYVVDGDTTTDNISNVSIDPLSNDNFTIPSGFSPSSTGEYDVTAFPSNINGNPDQEPSNDIETANILVYDTSYQRKPLYEVFTSSTCNPCQPGNENFENIMSNYPGDAVTVKFQQDFPGNGDPYATDESVDRRQNFYGVNAVPNMQIDGGWDGNANAFTASLHENAADRPAFVKIDAEYKVWPDSQQQKVEVCYEIQSKMWGTMGSRNFTMYSKNGSRVQIKQ